MLPMLLRLLLLVLLLLLLPRPARVAPVELLPPARRPSGAAGSPPLSGSPCSSSPLLPPSPPGVLPPAGCSSKISRPISRTVCRQQAITRHHRRVVGAGLRLSTANHSRAASRLRNPRAAARQAGVVVAQAPRAGSQPALPPCLEELESDLRLASAQAEAREAPHCQVAELHAVAPHALQQPVHLRQGWAEAAAGNRVPWNLPCPAQY